MSRFKDYFISYYRLYRHLAGIRHCPFQAVARRTETYFFDRGWGDPAVLKALADDRLVQESLPALEVQWGPEIHMGDLGLMREGRFVSPMDPHLIDPEARSGVFQLHLPKDHSLETPICIVFAMTGDEGFEFRYRTVSQGLLKQGIGTLLLENSYYGLRKPKAQRDFRLQTVQELLSMSVASVREGKALLKLLHEMGYKNVGVSGVSQGGMVASLVGAAANHPVPMAISLAAHSPEVVLSEGILGCFVDWEALRNTEADPVSKLKMLFSSGDITRLKQPHSPKLAFLLGAKVDKVVPKSSFGRISEHWKGSNVRWLPGTHVTSILWHSRAYRRLIRDSLISQRGANT